MYTVVFLMMNMMFGVSVTAWPHLTPGKDPVPIVQEAGWASGPVWPGAESLVPPHFPTGIRSPDRPTRRQSLYRLRYPSHGYTLKTNYKSSPKVLASWTHIEEQWHEYCWKEIAVGKLHGKLNYQRQVSSCHSAGVSVSKRRRIQCEQST